ncbi:MAG: amidohydrolase family protein [Beijerinckiaceae bacterium]
MSHDNGTGALKRGPFPEWIRETRRPALMPPAGSCDCQFHIYGDPQKYPPKRRPLYDPPNATFEDMKRVLSILGLDRGVIVYPMPYDTDNTLLFDVLRSLDVNDRARFKAVCIVKDEVSDREILDLKEIGVVGARFNIGKRWMEGASKESVRRNLERTRDLGLHARLHIAPEDLDEWGSVLRSVNGLTYIIDHMGSIDPTQGVNQPAMRWYLDVLKDENWFMMISNGNRHSSMDFGWDDVIPFGKTFVEHCPRKLVWGTDWPHVAWRKPMMNDAEPLELFYRYIDNDAVLMREILVQTPAMLHGFAT